MKTKVIRLDWNEVSAYTAYVEVPNDFDPNDYDLDNAVADLVNPMLGDYFERVSMTVTDESKFEHEDEVHLANNDPETLELDLFRW
jgi:hypothetical protein